MAQQKIQAGKLIDTVTKQELHEALGSHLRSWVAETAIGGKYTRFSGSVAVASSVVNLGGHVGQYFLGPNPGFVWDVRRLRISGLTAADVVSVYVNDISTANLVQSTTDLGDSPTNRYFSWNKEVVLYPGDALKIYGTGIAATGTITVSGAALELPIGLAWKLS